MEVRLPHIEDEEDEDEQVVDVHPQEELTIALDQPGGTGYLWELDEGAGDYRIVEQRIEADDSPDTFGGTGTQVFVVEPLAEGTTELVFRLKAPWSAEPEREHRLTLRSWPSADA